MPDIVPDMEDLLRKAADSYPLKNGDDRWEEIAQKLEQDPAVPPAKSNGSIFLKSGLLLLLFVFSFLWIHDHFNHTDVVTKANSATGKQGKLLQNTPANLPGANSHPDFNSTASTAKAVGITSQKSYLDKLSVPAGQQRLSQAMLNETPINKHDELVWNKRYKYTSKISLTGESNPQSRLQSRLQKLPPAVAILKRLPAKKNETAVNELRVPATTPLIKKNAGFYYGVSAGAELSGVKDQAFSKAGFRAGFLAGYRFNRWLSLESGLLFTQKNYSSSGAYFSKQAMHDMMPDVTEMKTLIGRSSMLEVPLMIKADLTQRSKSKVYTVVGVSSYLMTNETNKYDVMMNGSAQVMYGSYEGDKAYYTASFDIGIGFEATLGNNHAKLRIEPHIQLPLNGIGVGELPVKTAGIRIGLTRSGR